EVDATWGIPDDQVAALKANSDVTVESSPSTLVVTMWFNSSRPTFATSEVRNALWEAVDFDTIISTLFPDSGKVSDSVLAPNVFGSTPQDPKKYDPDAARAALEKAGFDFGQEIQIQYKEAEYTEFMSAIVSDLAKVGVKAVPVQKEAAVFLDDLLSLNWDVNFQLVGTPTYDAAQNLGRLYPCAANRNGYCNPELDAILAEAGSITDEDERLDLYDQANAIIWGDAVGMFPMVVNTTYAWRTGLNGFEPDPLTKPDLSHVGY
ncbi:ABC transporter substrate-binding protein, partial [Schumannella luteola]